MADHVAELVMRSLAFLVGGGSVARYKATGERVWLALPHAVAGLIWLAVILSLGSEVLAPSLIVLVLVEVVLVLAQAEAL